MRGASVQSPAVLRRSSGAGSIGHKGGTVAQLLGNAASVDTFLALSSVDFLVAGQSVVVNGYEVIGDCPVRFHVVKTVQQHRDDIGDQSWQPKPRLDALLNGATVPAGANDLVAVFKSTNGKITASQCGARLAGSPAFTREALAEGARRDNLEVVIDVEEYSLASTNHDGDLFGRPVDLNGNITRFSAGNTGGLKNGYLRLSDNWPSMNPKQRVVHIDSVYRAAQPPIFTDKRFMIEVIEADPLAAGGGNIQTWRKCNKSEYWIRENIITQNYSGDSTSIDDQCDAWRLGSLSMADYVQAYKYECDVASGANIESTVATGGAGNSQSAVKYRQTSSSITPEYFEYSLSSADDVVGVLLVYTASGTNDAHIELKDEYGNVVSELAVSNKSVARQDEPFVVAVQNPIPNRPIMIRITNRSPSSGHNIMRVAGVGCIVDNNRITSSEFDHIAFSLFTSGNNRVRSFFDGAMCYAIKEEASDVFGGESHGGETVNSRRVYLDGVERALVTGDKLTCRTLRIEQETRVQFVNGAYFDTKSRHQFSSFPAAHKFDAKHDFSDGFISTIAYGPMLTTHTTMNKLVVPERIDATANGYAGLERRYEFGKTEYVRMESDVNPFMCEMWMGTFSGIYNESTPWLKLGASESDALKFYYGAVSSSCCGKKDLSRQPFSTSILRTYD